MSCSVYLSIQLHLWCTFVHFLFQIEQTAEALCILKLLLYTTIEWEKKFFFFDSICCRNFFLLWHKISWFGRDASSSSNQAWVRYTLGNPCHQRAASWPWVCSSLPGVKQETETKMVTEARLNFSPGVWVVKLHNIQRGSGLDASVCFWSQQFLLLCSNDLQGRV